VSDFGATVCGKSAREVSKGLRPQATGIELFFLKPTPEAWLILFENCHRRYACTR
jgi:hypothetical protein